MENNIQKPIGLKSYIKEIENICKDSNIFRLGLRPDHLIIPLDSGWGRTTLTEYITDMFRENKILEFNSGLDDFLEISFDGTQDNMIQSFNSIDNAAIYTNEYSNIVALDLTGIVENPMGFKKSLFLDNCKRVCDNAFVIFFVSSIPNKVEERLIKNLTETIGNIKRLNLTPYTDQDFVQIVIKEIEDYGIDIKDRGKFENNVLDLIIGREIETLPEILDLAKELIHYADFKGYSPSISSKSIKSLISKNRQYLKGVS